MLEPIPLLDFALASPSRNLRRLATRSNEAVATSSNPLELWHRPLRSFVKAALDRALRDRAAKQALDLDPNLSHTQV